MVRECHGDLHLGNLVIVNNQVTMFDGIEFNDEFRWIDVMSDAAFVVMDLTDRGRPDLSHRFLNAYLEITGDYEGVQVLAWYLVYRSLVRAKVASIRASQDDLTPDERNHQKQQTDDYLHLANSYAHDRRPAIILTHGVSGSGKTAGTTRLLEEIGAIRIRSDVERKRITGPSSSDESNSALDAGHYSPNMNRKTYDRLAVLAKQIVQAGLPAVIDATFLRHQQRDLFRELATTLQVPFFIIPFEAGIEVLRTRIRDRSSVGNDASEATVAVMQRQLQTRERLNATELSHCRTVNDLTNAWKRGTPHE